MLHIVGALSWVAGYHSLGPAVDPVLAQFPIVRSLISCHHYGVYRVKKTINVWGVFTGPICPGHFVTPDRFLCLH